MNRTVCQYRYRAPHAFLMTLLALLMVGEAAAQSTISVDDVIIDPPTLATLGFSVPIILGDDNYDAVANVSYRQSGEPQWQAALPLLRVRPETISGETPPEDFGFVRPGEQFAGSVFNLAPDTAYDVQIEVIDPDGGSRTQIVQVMTRALPRSEPVVPRRVAVANSVELDSALQAAVAGDVITLAPGIYAGRFDLVDGSGTADNPIIVRGASDGGQSILDGTGQSVALNITNADHVLVEYLRIVGVTGVSSYGLRLSGQNLAARNLIIESDNGIDASNHNNRGFYICDNELTGPTVWPVLAVGATVNEKSWIGIGIRGQGHTVCHNSVSNFGSTIFIGYSGQSSPSDNLAIDMHNNDIVQSADDAFELDGSLRNVRVWENRISSALMGISFQPVWGGPIYAIRNLVFNTAAAPFKLNNDPSGVILYHNTVFRYAEADIFGPYDGNAWPQLGESFSYAANVKIKNNIMVGNDDALFLRQAMPHLELDYNGYLPNGTFGLQVGGIQGSYADIDAFSAGTGFETSGIALEQSIFATTPPASADYKIFFKVEDFALHSQSNAIDNGVLLPNINDGFLGNAPDLGATEYGGEVPVYGVRKVDTMAPAAPTDLSVTVP